LPGQKNPAIWRGLFSFYNFWCLGCNNIRCLWAFITRNDIKTYALSFDE
jgi:hypothetical protein